MKTSQRGNQQHYSGFAMGAALIFGTFLLETPARAQCADDSFEENDFAAQAHALGNPQDWKWIFGGLKELMVTPVVRPGDPDFFRVDLQPSGELSLTIRHLGPPGSQLNVSFYQSGQSGPPSTWNLTPATNSGSTHGYFPAGTYYVRVSTNSDVCVPYQLTFSAKADRDRDGAPNGNDNCEEFNPDQSDLDGDGIGDTCDEDCAAVCTDTNEHGACKEVYTMNNGGLVNYYASHGLTTPNACIRRIIFAVHGRSGKPWSIFGSVQSSAERNGVDRTTLIAAPEFVCTPVPGEVACETWVPPQLSWPSDDWTRGDNSSFIPQTSSFSVMDEFIASAVAAGRFPNLEEIIVTGHSGGGQYTHRYALGGFGPMAVPPSISVRYLPANPNTYTRLHALTFDTPPFDVFTGAVPPAQACPFPPWASNYTFDYKYGLQNRSITPYMNILTDSALVAQYLSRDVTYLIGENDSCNCGCLLPDGSQCDPSGESLDCSAEALAQGESRHARAYNYLEHLNVLDPNHGHRLVEVPNVGHISSGIYNCGETPKLMFGPNAIADDDGC